MNIRFFSFLIVLPLFMGLSFVDLTEEGSKVLEATADKVDNCEMVGKGTASTRSKRVFFKRKGERVQNELLGLAKNEAATLGANAIVAGEIGEDGKMKWAGYSCD